MTKVDLEHSLVTRDVIRFHGMDIQLVGDNVYTLNDGQFTILSTQSTDTFVTIKNAGNFDFLALSLRFSIISVAYNVNNLLFKMTHPRKDIMNYVSVGQLNQWGSAYIYDLQKGHYYDYNTSIKIALTNKASIDCIFMLSFFGIDVVKRQDLTSGRK